MTTVKSENKLTPDQIRDAKLVAGLEVWSFDPDRPLEVHGGKDCIIFGSNTFPQHRVIVSVEDLLKYINDIVAAQDYEERYSS